MKQFYETYEDTKLSTLLTEISWTNYLHILPKTKILEEKYYYLELASKNCYSARSLSGLIDSGTFERTLIADRKLSAVMRVFTANIRGVFKESYVF